MKKLLLIYNPQAGKGKLNSRLPAILEQLSQAGWLVTACPTAGPGDAARLAASLAGQYQRVVCSGGDGTLNEVVAGLSALTDPPPLGYIPAGTTNDSSRNLSLPKTPEEAARLAATGEPVPCDTGRFNDRVFLYVAAFGAFTDVSYDTPQPFKNTFGHLAYVLEGATRLPGLKSYPLTVEHDGVEQTGEFLYGMASNTVSIGGFPLPGADRVALDDGLFEVILLRAPKTAAQLQTLLRALAGQLPEDTSGPLLHFRTARLTVTCPTPLPWTLDGEYGGCPAVAHIENCHHGIRIIRGPA